MLAAVSPVRSEGSGDNLAISLSSERLRRRAAGPSRPCRGGNVALLSQVVQAYNTRSANKAGRISLAGDTVLAGDLRHTAGHARSHA